MIDTVACHCNAVQYDMILHTSLLWLRLNINLNLNPQKTPYVVPWRAITASLCLYTQYITVMMDLIVAMCISHSYCQFNMNEYSETTIVNQQSSQIWTRGINRLPIYIMSLFHYFKHSDQNWSNDVGCSLICNQYIISNFWVVVSVELKWLSGNRICCGLYDEIIILSRNNILSISCGGGRFW